MLFTSKKYREKKDGTFLIIGFGGLISSQKLRKIFYQIIYIGKKMPLPVLGVKNLGKKSWTAVWSNKTIRDNNNGL